MDINGISAINVKNSCRTCLLPSENLENVFDSFYNGSKIARILMSVAPILVSKDDGLSELICEGCKINIINSYKFQQLCITSDKSIRMLIEKSIHRDISQIRTIKTEDLTEQDEVQTEIAENIGATLSVTLGNDNPGVMVPVKSPEPSNTDSVPGVPTAGPESEFGNGSSINSEISDDSDEDYSDGGSSGEDSDKKFKPDAFFCDICDKSFKSQAKLTRHAKIHDPNAKKRKNSQGSLKKSATDDAETDPDDTKQSFECNVCNKTFKKPSLLARHVKTHDPNKRPFECQKCDKRFPSEVALVRHDILHSDLVERSKLPRNESQDFTCVVCGKLYKTPESLTSHIKGHKSDSSDNSQHSCRLCMEFFPSLAELIKHSKNHIENATHQCAICNKMFAMGDELIDHMLRHKGLKPHQCHICDKSFLKLHKLNVHMRTHSDDKPFLCPECGKSLSTNENLKRHLIRHTGIKPYACNLCPSRFVFKSGLTSHMSTHTGLKPFICDICGSSFTKSSSLTKHHRIHTGERPYVCEVCGMRFNSSDHVKRHMRTHTGERPYKCQYCDRSYAQSNDLLKHTRIHVGENTYRCNLCNSAFRLQAQLREHYRIHYDLSFQRDDMTEMKPQIIPQIPQENQSQNQNHNLSNLVLDSTPRRDQPIMHFPQYNLIKHESKEMFQDGQRMEQDDQSSVKSYHDLSIAKKQKIE